MKRKALAAIMAVAMAVSMAGCGGSTSESKDSTQKTETADSTASTGGSVENKDKPLCWFNRQPSSSATGELDKDALNFNGNTYYVGFDANQGAELQGQMVLDYIKKNADTIDSRTRSCANVSAANRSTSSTSCASSQKRCGNTWQNLASAPLTRWAAVPTS